MIDNNFEYSVVIPVYNDFGRLERAIDSVVNQIVKPLEIIIVDDASDIDFHSAEYAVSIKYIKLKKNSGSFNARKVGIQNAKTNFIFFLDSDDTWNPNHAIIHSYIWKRNHAENLVMIGTLLAPEANTDLSNEFSKKNRRLMRKGQRNIGFLELFSDNPFYNSASSFSKRALEDVLFSNTVEEEFQFCEDLYLLCKFLTQKNRIILSPLISGEYNLSGERKSTHHAQIYKAVLRIAKIISSSLTPHQRPPIFLGLLVFQARWIYGIQNESKNFSSYQEKFIGLDSYDSCGINIRKIDNRFCFYLLRFLVQSKKRLPTY